MENIKCDKNGVQPWYKTTFRWGQTNLTEDDPLRCDLDFWREQWKRTQVQGLIVNCGGIVAYYPSKDPHQERAKFLGDRDFFGEFTKAARDAGLVVIARMDINRAHKDFYDAHPDWFCVDRAGNPITSQGRYLSCVNGGYYEEYIPAVLREIIATYHPDGFADNSWKGLGRSTICYCENCKTSFREACGLELPQAVSWDDPVYRAWVRWGYQRRTQLWEMFNRVTQEAGGEDCLWCGMFHASPHHAGQALTDLRALCQHSKIIFCDHQSRDDLNGTEQNGLNGSLLRLASEEQILVPESMAHYVRGPLTFRLAANPANETAMWMLDGIAGGLSPWYHHVGGGQNDKRQFTTSTDIFQWHKAHEDCLYNREDLANVGLVWNQETADFYGRSEVHDKVELPWRGFTRALTKARIPYLPIHASDIARYAHRIKTLILPDLAILSKEQLDDICAFVQNGGNLVFTGVSGTCNADGEASQDDRLWRITGLRHTGENIGIFGKVNPDWELGAAHSYLLLPDERHEILSAFDNTRLLAFGGGLRVTESTGRLKPVMGYIPSFPIYPPEFSWIREERPDIGTVFAGTLESGSRVVYFAADIDRCYGRCGLPDHGRLLSDAILWTLNGERPLEVEGPGYLDCRIYAQPGRRIIHLVNLTGCNADSYCDECIPVGPVTVTVPGKDGPVSIQLDQIERHEMIVLDD
jgi:hypothetical protein